MNQKIDPAAEPMVARDATYHRAPDALREKVRAGLAREARAADRARPAKFFAMAASFAAVALVSWNLAMLNAQPSSGELVTRDLV
ncbi:MAG TPA: hypothetical protein VII36_08570, partial [Usitatibacter sp.]